MGPLGFCKEATEGKIKFYREVEVKHARMAMLAAIGFPLAEQFHPLFASDDAPSFNFSPPTEATWSMKSEHVSGDYFSFDPLGLKPTTPAELKEMQTKELNNGRLAMIAI